MVTQTSIPATQSFHTVWVFEYRRYARPTQP